jgi:hypothetical protein
MGNIHIDWSKGAMSDRTADSSSKSKPRVEGKALRLLLRADLGHSSGSGHCGSFE